MLQYLLHTEQRIHRSMFIKKRIRIPDLYPELIRGYWKMLALYEHDDRFVPEKDLHKIRSLVMHKEIAPKLLDYSNATHPFVSMIKISVYDDDNNVNNDKETEQTQNKSASNSIFGLTAVNDEKEKKESKTKMTNRREYEVLFWNGSSPTQCSCFQIRKVSSDRTNYYMYYEPHKQNIEWVVYDHETCGYGPYEHGTSVDAQIEASFQSNLPWNFPKSCYPTYDTEYFNHSNLNRINQINNVDNWVETYALRCYFRDVNEDKRRKEHGEMYHMEEYMWSHNGRYAFPRNLKRQNRDTKEDNECCTQCFDDDYGYCVKWYGLRLQNKYTNIEHKIMRLVSFNV